MTEAPLLRTSGQKNIQKKKVGLRRLSPKQVVEILNQEMKDRPDGDKSVLREGQIDDKELPLSDEIQQHCEADVLDIVAPLQAVMEKEIVAPAPGSSDDEFESSPVSRQSRRNMGIINKKLSLKDEDVEKLGWWNRETAGTFGQEISAFFNYLLIEGCCLELYYLQNHETRRGERKMFSATYPDKMIGRVGVVG